MVHCAGNSVCYPIIFLSQSLCQLCSDVMVVLRVQPKWRRCSARRRWPQPWWTSTWRWPPRTLSGRRSSRACRRSWSSSTPARSVNHAAGAAAAAGQQATRLLSDWSIELSPLSFTWSCDCFYIVLFSTIEQTHAFVTLWLCMRSCWLFIVRFGYLPEWCACSTFGLLHGWCQVNLLAFRRILCTPYNNAPCHITSCKATYVAYSACMFSCSLHFWQNGQDLFLATVVTQGGMVTETKVSTGRWP